MSKPTDWPEVEGWHWAKFEDGGIEITSAGFYDRCVDRRSNKTKSVMCVWTAETGHEDYYERDAADFYHREYVEEHAGKAKYIPLKEACPFEVSEDVPLQTLE